MVVLEEEDQLRHVQKIAHTFLILVDVLCGDVLMENGLLWKFQMVVGIFIKTVVKRYGKSEPHPVEVEVVE